MSKHKYQLKKLLPSLSEQAKKCKDRVVKQRLYLIKSIVSSERTLKGACEFRGVCRDSFYRWTRRLLKQKNIEALRDISKRPKHSPNQTTPRIERKIQVIKKKEPYLGPDRISRALEDRHSMVCPPSTIYAVLRRNKLISKEYRKKRTKKHLKRYRRPIPGFLQMDFKYVPFDIEGLQYYQLSAIDHNSSWRFIRCYPHKGESETLEFLQQLKEECPFPILEIQTDNDIAFTDKFSVGLGIKPTGAHPMDQWCAKHNIRHKLIPVGEKELNGKVENSHKYDDEEFYSYYRIANFMDLQTYSLIYNHNWNHKRATRALEWKTPCQTIEPYQLTLSVLQQWMSSIWEDHLIAQQDTMRNAMKELMQKPLKPKKLDPLDRYLQWMDWDAAQYRKYSWIPVSYISMNYSLTRLWIKSS